MSLADRFDPTQAKPTGELSKLQRDPLPPIQWVPPVPVPETHMVDWADFIAELDRRAKE